MVLCCICGVDIRDHGYGARCAQCLQKEVDITEGVSRRLIVQRCGTCGRWLKQGGQYVAADMESRELLSVCLKHVKGLSKERTLVDAGFIWTEPHSKEIKVKLVLQQEVMGGLVVQQTMVVDFRIQNLQCAGCTKLYTRHFWESNVQVRQRSAGNRRTLEALEQLIIKHNAHTNLIKCEATKEGLDFFFRSERDSQSFVGFIKSWAVVRFHDSKHLVSHDTHNTTYRFKKTTFIELCPICRDDLVLLPPKAAQALGGVPPLMLCTRSVSVVGLVEPASGRSIEVTSMDYWKRPFTTVCGAKQLTEFVVLDVLPLEEGGGQQPAHRGRSDARTVSMCEVEIARVSDFGQNEERAIVRCHLGHTLHVSDIVLGYDLRTLNHGLDEELWSELPLDIYLVKKQKVKQKKPMSSKAKKQSGKSGSRAASTREAEDDKTDVASVQDEDDEEAKEDKELSTAAAQMCRTRTTRRRRRTRSYPRRRRRCSTGWVARRKAKVRARRLRSRPPRVGTTLSRPRPVSGRPRPRLPARRAAGRRLPATAPEVHGRGRRRSSRHRADLPVAPRRWPRTATAVPKVVPRESLQHSPRAGPGRRKREVVAEPSGSSRRAEGQ